jgi:hypothetical protein
MYVARRYSPEPQELRETEAVTAEHRSAPVMQLNTGKQARWMDWMSSEEVEMWIHSAVKSYVPLGM